MSVPNRRPPRPHSSSKSRSPRRQRLAMNPSQVTKPNSSTKTISATQFTSRTISPSLPMERRCSAPLGHEIDQARERRSDQHPQQLVPVEERNAGTVGHDLNFAAAGARER